MTPEEQERLARSRFAILNAVRTMGVAIMLFGMGVVATGMFRPSNLIGGVIFAIGFLDSLIVPQILARKWRTPPES